MTFCFLVSREFDCFIVCPQKYYDNNEAARKYPHMISYETIRDYVKKNDSPLYQAYYQQICQVIEKAKKPAEVILNEQANAFFQKYKDYQEQMYSSLDMRTTRKANGYWVHYATSLPNVYLDHKIQEGRVDLTFNKAANKVGDLRIVAEWLRNHNVNTMQAKEIAKSASLQITVPKLDMSKPFEEVDIEDVKMCFESITELIKFAEIVAIAGNAGEK